MWWWMEWLVQCSYKKMAENAAKKMLISLFTLLKINAAGTLSPIKLFPLSGASVLVFTRASLFGRRHNTCRRNTILLASCISLSSCSWWASSCSSHDFSSSWPSFPREGHSPHRATSSERMKGETRVNRREFCTLAVGIYRAVSRPSPRKIKSGFAAEPTCQGFLLRRLRFVARRFPMALLIGSRLLFNGVCALRDDILLFGGMRGAG